LLLAGFSVVTLAIGGLAAWFLLVPIEGAVVAPGVVSVDTNRKTIQHLEGGIVEAILVREGDRVRKGEVIIRLQNTLRLSVLNQLQAQYFDARAVEARLIAERDGQRQIAFPPELLEKAADHEAQTAMIGQRSIFESRRRLLSERLAVLGQRIASLKEEIAGLKGQISSARKQTALIDEELAGVVKLFRKKLIGKPRLLALQRRKAEIEGSVSAFRATIARANQGIQEARLRMSELQSSTINEVVEQLRDERARAYETTQKLAAAKDVLRRTEIRSPIDGNVVNLDVHTLGGVISAGQPLLDIVPSNEKLVVNASIDPLDIEQVRAGLPAYVLLTAFSRRTHHPIDGTVVTVSADRLTQAQSGLPYYLARIELRTDTPQFQKVTLQPGMTAQVMIRTGARTPLEYILGPITRNMGLAMREN
jgi:epimerase transport system membrane fusion protein